ncbi:MAG: peptide ABC transporter substrate-binding protein [Chlamydiota bacterium]
MKRSDKKEAKKFKQECVRLSFLEGGIFSFHPHDLALIPEHQSLAKWAFEGLTRIDDHGTLVLAGAEKIECSSCKKKYTISLKANCYSDGTHVVAQDYEKAWKQALSLDSRCAKSMLLYPIKNAKKAKKGLCSVDEVGVSSLDDQTLVVELDYPTPYFLELLANPVFFPFKETENGILGNGPYKIDKRDKDVLLTLTINPFFWAANEIQIKKISLAIIEDENTAFCLYENGELDFVGDPLSSLPHDALQFVKDRDDFYEKEILRPYWVYLNRAYYPFSSPAIRRAFKMAIDRDSVAKHILPGSLPLHHLLPTSISSYTPQTVEQNPVAEFEKGLKELNLTRKTFPPLTLNFPSYFLHKKLASYLQQTWKNLFGIEVFLNLQEFQTFFSEMQRGTYEVGGMFHSLDYNDPFAALELLISTDRYPNKWKDPLFTAAVETARVSDGPEKNEAVRKAEEILAEELPVIPVTTQCIQYLCHPRLKGVVFNKSGILDLRWAYFD